MTAQGTRKALKTLGYLVFFFVFFLVSLVITFPYDRLTGFAEAQAREAMGVEVSIEGIRPTITGGARLEGVTLGPSLPVPGAAQASTSPFIHIDRAWVNLSFLRLLLGAWKVSFEGEVVNGTIQGRFEKDETHTALEVKAVGVQARDIPWLREKVGLPVSGTINADLAFDIPVGEATKSTGALTFSMSGGVIGDGQAKLSLSSLMGYGGSRASSSSDEGTVIQPINLGPIALDTKVVNGEIEIPRIEATSVDAELTFEGRINLGEPLATTRVDTYLTLKLTDAYAQQDEQTETLVSLANTVGVSAKRPDGAFGFRISGSFLRGVTFRPSKIFTTVGGRSPRDRSLRGADRTPPRPRPSRPPLSRRAQDDDDDDGDDGPRLSPAARPPGAALAPRPSIMPPNQRPAPPPPPYPSGMPRPAPSPPPSVIGRDRANDSPHAHEAEQHYQQGSPQEIEEHQGDDHQEHEGEEGQEEEGEEE